MKLYKLYVVLSLWATGSLGLASCSDFLKEEPYAFVGPDQLGNDNAAVDLWLTGVYSKWGNNMFRYSSFPRCLELDSDYITGPDWASVIWERETFRRTSMRLLFGRVVII